MLPEGSAGTLEFWGLVSSLGELMDRGRKEVLGGLPGAPNLFQGQRHEPVLPFPGAGFPSKPSLKFLYQVSPGSRGGLLTSVWTRS